MPHRPYVFAGTGCKRTLRPLSTVAHRRVRNRSVQANDLEAW